MLARVLSILISGVAFAGPGVHAAAIYDGGQLAGLTGVPVTLGGTTTYYDVAFEFGEYSAVFGSDSALPPGWPFRTFTAGTGASLAIAAALNAQSVPSSLFAGGQSTAYIPFSIGPQFTATGGCDFCVASRAVLYFGGQWADSGGTPWVRTSVPTQGASVGPQVTWARLTAVPAPGGLVLLLTGVALLGARAARTGREAPGSLSSRAG